MQSGLLLPVMQRCLITGGLCQSHIGIIRAITNPARRFSQEWKNYSEAIEANGLLYYGVGGRVVCSYFRLNRRVLQYWQDSSGGKHC